MARVTAVTQGDAVPFPVPVSAGPARPGSRTPATFAVGPVQVGRRADTRRRPEAQRVRLQLRYRLSPTPPAAASPWSVPPRQRRVRPRRPALQSDVRADAQTLRRVEFLAAGLTPLTAPATRHGTAPETGRWHSCSPNRVCSPQTLPASPPARAPPRRDRSPAPIRSPSRARGVAVPDVLAGGSARPHAPAAATTRWRSWRRITRAPPTRPPRGLRRRHAPVAYCRRCQRRGETHPISPPRGLRPPSPARPARRGALARPRGAGWPTRPPT